MVDSPPQLEFQQQTITTPGERHQVFEVILPILLMESEKPLLIDQPEDNLDNRYVSAKVVSTIAAVKQQRQLIFVTHNPNIPVLGDAEQVFVMDSNGTAARLLRQGSVDDCRHEIVNLLEGGKEAFAQRAERYHR